MTRRWLSNASMLIALGLALTTAVAQEKVDPATLGPQVGAKAIPFTLPDQTGTPRALGANAGPNGTMLVFFRSADW